MCAISIIEGGALYRDSGVKTPCRWCYFSVQVVLMRRNSHLLLHLTKVRIFASPTLKIPLSSAKMHPTRDDYELVNELNRPEYS